MATLSSPSCPAHPSSPRRGRHTFHPLHVKALLRQAQALAGLSMHRQALHAYEEVLKVRPVRGGGGRERVSHVCRRPVGSPASSPVLAQAQPCPLPAYAPPHSDRMRATPSPPFASLHHLTLTAGPRPHFCPAGSPILRRPSPGECGASCPPRYLPCPPCPPPSQLDPAHADARLGLQSSEHSLLESVVQGLHLERRSLPPPAPDLRIAMLPQSTPMHRMRRGGGAGGA